MVTENTITPSCGNVFSDLGFEKAEAQVLAMRADLTIALEKAIKAQGSTHERRQAPSKTSSRLIKKKPR